jgi:hypothetical protein
MLLYNKIYKKEVKMKTQQKAELIDQVASREDAEVVIAKLLQKFAGATAKSRLKDKARLHKQSLKIAAKRASSNLLTSFDVRRPL